MRLLALRTLQRAYSTAAPASKPAAKQVKSMTPAGTVLKGLNVKKGGEDPVALAEEEYPAWLWEILDEKAQQKKLDENPDRKAAHERRQANRKLIKNNNFIAGMNK